MGALLSFLFATRTLPQLHFARKPATVAWTSRDDASSEKCEECSLETLIYTRCPSVSKSFNPPWWLPSGDFQTAYCVVGNFSQVDYVPYDRTFLRTLDGGTLGLDFTPPKRTRSLRPHTPIVVVLHGLTGGSYESYVRAVLAPACDPVELGGLGYRAVVVNFRGCAGVPVTSPQLYSAGDTGDLRVALMHISKLYPEAPLLGVGFSLGANILVRYLAEEGDRSRFKAACVLGCPWDLLANGERLRASWWRRTIYSKSMGTNLQRIVQNHAKQLAACSNIAQAIPQVLALARPTIVEFDSIITCLAGGSDPSFPFASAYDYYTWASSHHVLADIRVPLLALHAADDPIVSVLPTDGAAARDTLNPWVVFAVTPGGGHLGWFEQGPARVQRWFARPVLEWLRTMGEEVHVPGRARPRGVAEHNGFLTEEGVPHVGCHVLDGADLVGAPAAAPSALFAGL